MPSGFCHACGTILSSNGSCVHCNWTVANLNMQARCHDPWMPPEFTFTDPPVLVPYPEYTSLLCSHGSVYNECWFRDCVFSGEQVAQERKRIDRLNEQAAAEQRKRADQARVAAQHARAEALQKQEAEAGLVIEPYWGYKALDWNGDTFRSPSFQGHWTNQELTAVCRNDIGRSHPVPHSRCGCGIYGTYTLTEPLHYTKTCHHTPTIALIKADRRVIPAENGFRAAHAQIMATYTRTRRARLQNIPHRKGLWTDLIELAPSTLADQLGLRPNPQA